MRLGLLLIDSLDEPLRSIGGDYPERFTRLFATAGAELELFDGQADELPDPARCEGWIIPGSRQSVYDDLAWIKNLEGWAVEVVERQIPLIGICFGHQLIAQALGGRVEKAAGGWNIGAIDYEIVDHPPFVDAFPASFRLLASHQDQVVEEPPGAIRWTTSPTCESAGYLIGDHVITVQNHPEFDPALVAALYETRRERIGERQVDEALATLERPLDNERCAAWLVSVVS